MFYLTLLFNTLLALIALNASAYRVKRIVGGNDASPREFPYQVSLRYYDLHVCGGALISKIHVLSAAHCICGIIDEPYEELSIVTGTIKINGDGKLYKIKNVHCHPNFEFGLESSWENDVVVITLNSSVTVDDAQTPIALPELDIVKSSQGVITGWGKSNVHGFLHAKLQKLSVAILSNQDCQRYYNNSILPSQICTYNGKGSGACKGDSGSPLVSDGILVGIFSWTKPCALGAPDVFSRVHYFSDFIKKSMNQNTEDLNQIDSTSSTVCEY